MMLQKNNNIKIRTNDLCNRYTEEYLREHYHKVIDYVNLANQESLSEMMKHNSFYTFQLKISVINYGDDENQEWGHYVTLRYENDKNETLFYDSLRGTPTTIMYMIKNLHCMRKMLLDNSEERKHYTDYRIRHIINNK